MLVLVLEDRTLEQKHILQLHSSDTVIESKDKSSCDQSINQPINQSINQPRVAAGAFVALTTSICRMLISMCVAS